MSLLRSKADRAFVYLLWGRLSFAEVLPDQNGLYLRLRLIRAALLRFILGKRSRCEVQHRLIDQVTAEPAVSRILLRFCRSAGFGDPVHGLLVDLKAPFFASSLQISAISSTE